MNAQISRTNCLSTLPQFPQFAKLSIGHKEEISKFVSQFEPYSDFNFVSLFCWDKDGSTEVSTLYGNLVVRMADYTTDQFTYSILGSNEIDSSLNQLFELTEQLELVPEAVINNIADKQQFVISEDRDQFDYIYPIRSHIDLSGGHFKVKRNKINGFTREYMDQISLKKTDFCNKNDHTDIHDVMRCWAASRHRSDEEVKRESQAIERLLENGKYFELVGVQLYLNGKCIAFSINEVLDDTYALCHFQKAVLDFENVDVFLSNVIVRDLAHFGCKYINWEQDLGIPGLRALKQSYSPEFYLKKYTVTKA